MSYFETKFEQGKAFNPDNSASKPGSLKESWDVFQVNRSAKKLLSSASKTIDRVYLKAMEGSSMAFAAANETILELDSERAVPGTSIYGLEIEYAMSMEDEHDHSQINITTWENGGEQHVLYFEQIDMGPPKLVGISQSKSEKPMSYSEQKKVLNDVTKAVKFAKNQTITINH